MSTTAKARLHALLAGLGARAPYFSYKAIQAAVNEAELDLKDSSLKSYLSRAVKEGVVHDAGRGWYSRLSDPVRLDPKPLRPLVRAIEKAFPLLDFTVWSTGQLNPWMHHLIAKPVAFVHAPSDALEAVGDLLKSKGYAVWVNPTGRDKQRFGVGENTVVLRPAVSRAPGEGHDAAPEAVLVDLFMELERLNLMDPHEFRGMAGELAKSSRLDVPDLITYASRRKQDWEELFGKQAINSNHLFAIGGIG